MTEAELALRIEVRSGEALVGSVPASATACLEDAWFQGVVAGRFPNDGVLPEFEVTPLTPDGSAGEAPAVTALLLSHAAQPARRYDAAVFGAQARHAIATLRQAGRLRAQDPASWRLVALGREPETSATVRVSRAPFPLVARALPGRGEDTFCVEVEDELLARIQRRTAAGGAVEVASLLLGTLSHDEARRAAVLRLGAEIPLQAGSGGASGAHFAFGPTSFVAARREAARRRDGLVPGGWAHSHPACVECTRRRHCEADTVFFSTQDEEVHASAFARPFMVALVSGKRRHLPARRPGFRLYGWQRARIACLDFQVVGPNADAFREEVRPLASEES